MGLGPESVWACAQGQYGTGPRACMGLGSRCRTGLIERYNKIIKKIDYLNKRSDRIDELMWVFCKSECVK